ncbi:MAG: hypothetical protein CMH97_11900 [Oceanospirillaceae bacterium]|nr:hypothetical protein [Oceanospirillaceae bacterium]|tara:strand:+ start:10823 stop:11401 length:579 start_codon:yes stop_codon:yes gene_type:complete
MHIYRIEPMSDKFGMLELSSKAITEAYGDLGYEDLREAETNLADSWPECGAALYDYHSTNVRELHALPDIYTWNGCFLVLSERAKCDLEDLLSPLGEFLPFTLDDHSYHLLSLHNVVNPKSDQTEELFENGIPIGIKSLAFDLPDIGVPAAFKTGFDYFNHVYCTEQFKKRLMASDLDVGVTFVSELAYRRP